MLGGDSSLINIRSRGVTSRPLQKIVDRRLEAEKERREEIQKYRKEAEEAQTKINELQRSKTDDSQKLVLSPEQMTERNRLFDKQKAAQKNLRNSEKELRRDIERMQAKYIWLNIALMPCLVMFSGLGLAVIRIMKVKNQ
jgi:seryl-tRNA synthetase